jgi:hypothetical protein
MTVAVNTLISTRNMRYSSAVARHTSLYLDEELLRGAADVLGTSGPTGTVKAALEDVVRRARLKSLANWEIDLTPSDLDQLRRPRSSSAGK